VGQRRVVHIITRLTGGAAVAACSLTGELHRQGWDVTLVYGRVGASEASFEHAVDPRVPTVEITGLGPHIRPWSDFVAYIHLVMLLREMRPDVVHTHMAKAGLLGRLAAGIARRPRPVVVHTFHGHVLTGYFGRATSVVYTWLERWLARITDALLAPSQGTADQLVALGIGETGKFRVVPYGFDLSRFASSAHLRTAARSQLGIGSRDVLLVFVGRLVPIKRLDVLLQAVARAHGENPHVRLALVGEGTSRAELERLATNLGLASVVRFLGFREDVVPILAAGDVAVLSSANEGSPLALIEAGAAGLPAIATAVGGVPEVLTPETGVLVPAGDHASLATAILRVSGNASLREKMGVAARARSHDRFSLSATVNRVSTIYEELLRVRTNSS